MAIGRTTKISILLIIDTAFFFVELIVGYAVGSLALVADSFHMLNDVISLVIALYAIKLSKRTAISSKYSYGWHRAEILAALVNGVFLMALCFSIFLEAIERFVNVQEVGNPKLVVIVGSLGLGSNIIGLFLFHEHGHSHSHASHSHSHKPPVTSETEANTNPLPYGTAGCSHLDAKSKDATHVHATATLPEDGLSARLPDSDGSDYVHPAQVRASLVKAAEDLRAETGDGIRLEPVSASPRTSLHAGQITDVEDLRRAEEGESPGGHGHGHSHSHNGSMNMRAVMLHVMGDALGNIGVIVAGLVIWLTSWKQRFYCDPLISLLITVIIFSSALPLVKSTAFVLLQGVPTSVSLDAVRAAILAIPDVISVHELHIWQLSESKIIASAHVLVRKHLDASTPTAGMTAKEGHTLENGEHVCMSVAAEIRRILHGFGIHSSTIQPEYIEDDHAHSEAAPEYSACLISCTADEECDPANACCPPLIPAPVQATL